MVKEEIDRTIKYKEKEMKEKLKFLYENQIIHAETILQKAKEKNLLNDIFIMKHYYIAVGKIQILEKLMHE